MKESGYLKTYLNFFLYCGNERHRIFILSSTCSTSRIWILNWKIFIKKSLIQIF